MILCASVYVYVFVLIIKKLDFLYIIICIYIYNFLEREIKALNLGVFNSRFANHFRRYRLRSQFFHLWSYR